MRFSPVILIAMLFLSGSARGFGGTGLLFARAPDRGAAAESLTVSGVYQVTFHVTVLSGLPADTTVACRAAIAPALGLDREAGRGSGSAIAESALSMAELRGETAVCMVRIPFAWCLTGSANGGLPGVMLSFEVDAVQGGVVRRFVQQPLAEYLPARGGSRDISLNITF